MASLPRGWYIGAAIGDDRMSIVIAKGAEADTVLADPAFRERWAALHADCPWSSVFQSPGFLIPWYRVYRPVFEPVLAWRETAGGGLTGLLPLAVARDGGAWQVAGAPQAEYQAWLARPEDDRAFVGDALAALRESGMAGPLTFAYLPPETPLDWARSPPWRRLCQIEPWSRPLRRIDEDAGASLKKKSNKSRLNRLARIGPLRFERITERAALEQVIEPIEIAYDLRQAAVHGGRPFREDPLKRAFHLALLEQPGVLHVTLLWAGDRLLAAHIGAADRSVVHNGIIAFDLPDAALSPGKVHQMLMFRDMAEDGIGFFDLTPGGDPWKERFATEHQTVFRLTLHENAWRKRAAEAERQAKASVRRLLGRVGVDPSGLRARLSGERREEQVALYRMSAESLPVPQGGGPLAVDCLADLVAYEPRAGAKSLQRFAREATGRLEAGQRAYTAQEAGRLVFCGWLIETPAKMPVTPFEARLEHPPGRVVLRIEDVASGGLAADRLGAGLTQMLTAAAAVEGAREILVGLPASAPALRAAAEALGLTSVEG